MYEAVLLNALKEKHGITTTKNDEHIIALAKYYINGEIDEQFFTSMLNFFATAN